MTRAPANLLAVRSLLLTHLDNAPGPDDLDAAEAGIVPDPLHRGGYHCGSDRTVTNDYSVVESPRDKAGLTDYASALDVGGFSVTAGGRTHTLSSFSLWCVGQCVANAADTRDIREIIYSPDGNTVKRWDRLGKRSSGDSSHRWHTHFSFHRDAIKAGRDLTPLFRRYLTTIGLLEDDVSAEDLLFPKLIENPITKTKVSVATFLVSINSEAYRGRLLDEAILAAVKGVDTKAILARIEQVATAEVARDQVAAAERAELAELVRQGNSGELDAAEVVRLIGEKLADDSTAA
ncbi:hypothetical protein ACWD6N_03430 [Micromonospora sp. NPDC005163]